jgi:hypothetical protein
MGPNQDRPLTPEEMDKLQQEIDQQYAEKLGLANDIQYNRQPAPGEKGKIIQYINSIDIEKTRYVYDADKKSIGLKIVSGDITPELYRKMSGFLAPQASMSHLDDIGIGVGEVHIDKLKLLIRVSMPRDDYTPEFALKLHNAANLARLKLHQNLNGNERYYCAAEVLDEKKSVSVERSSQTIARNLLDRVRGKGQ